MTVCCPSDDQDDERLLNFSFASEIVEFGGLQHRRGISADAARGRGERPIESGTCPPRIRSAICSWPARLGILGAGRAGAGRGTSAFFVAQIKRQFPDLVLVVGG